MSPLELMVLLHYRGHTDDFRGGDFSAPAVRDAIERFRDDYKLLEPTESMDVYHDPHYRLTARGHAFVKALCSTPLPVQVWVMPCAADFPHNLKGE